MARLSFSPRTYRLGLRKVRLVRYAYSPKAKRSVTRRVGLLDTMADPDDLTWGLQLHEAEQLTEDDLCAVRQWLRSNGAPEAQALRAQARERIRGEVVHELTRQQGADSLLNPLQALKKHLEAATAALPAHVQALRAKGQDPWGTLRHDYLQVNVAYESFFEMAQAQGVASRRKKAVQPDGCAPSSAG